MNQAGVAGRITCNTWSPIRRGSSWCHVPRATLHYKPHIRSLRFKSGHFIWVPDLWRYICGEHHLKEDHDGHVVCVCGCDMTASCCCCCFSLTDRRQASGVFSGLTAEGGFSVVWQTCEEAERRQTLVTQVDPTFRLPFAIILCSGSRGETRRDEKTREQASQCVDRCAPWWTHNEKTRKDTSSSTRKTSGYHRDIGAHSHTCDAEQITIETRGVSTAKLTFTCSHVWSQASEHTHKWTLLLLLLLFSSFFSSFSFSPTYRTSQTSRPSLLVGGCEKLKRGGLLTLSSRRECVRCCWWWWLLSLFVTPTVDASARLRSPQLGAPKPSTLDVTWRDDVTITPHAFNGRAVWRSDDSSPLDGRRG